jgi:hypothetical protein
MPTPDLLYIQGVQPRRGRREEAEGARGSGAERISHTFGAAQRSEEEEEEEEEEDLFVFNDTNYSLRSTHADLAPSVHLPLTSFIAVALNPPP